MAFDPGEWWNKSNNWQKGAAGLSAGATLIPSLFGGDKADYKNPASSASPYLDKIPGQIAPYYNPYIEQGKRVDPRLESEYGAEMGYRPQLEKSFETQLNNPGELYNKLGEGYTESPGYKFKLSEALRGSNNARAAGGMLGSPLNEEENARIAGNLSSDDFEKYLNHMMSIYGGGQAGLSGLYNKGIEGEQGLSTRGYGASTGYGDILGQNEQNKANLAFSGSELENKYNTEQEKSKDSGWGDIASLASLAAFL